MKAYSKNIQHPSVTLGLRPSDFARLKKLQATYERHTRIGVSRSIIVALALEALEQQMSSEQFAPPLHAHVFGFQDETSTSMTPLPRLGGNESDYHA